MYFKIKIKTMPKTKRPSKRLEIFTVNIWELRKAIYIRNLMVLWGCMKY